jgi:CRP-like cAMP-binding protein
VPKRNLLLRSLGPDDMALLDPHLEACVLSLRTELDERDEHIDVAIFVESGVISIIASSSDAKAAEIGLVGPEGMTAIPILLGDFRAQHLSLVQAPGTGYKIQSDKFRTAILTSRSLHHHLLKYVLTFLVQTAHTALANGRDDVEHRLSRWLLMAHDRLEGDHLPFTHEILAIMLGVQRPSVTVALHSLRERGVIRLARGGVIVLDRAGLEQHAGESYGAPESEYRRLIGVSIFAGTRGLYGTS